MIQYHNLGNVSHLLVHKFILDGKTPNSIHNHGTNSDTPNHPEKYKYILSAATASYCVTSHRKALDDKFSQISPSVLTVSLYPKVKSTNSKGYNLVQFLKDIKSGTGTSNRDVIQKIRRELNEEQAKALKESLPAITPSGLFRGRRTKCNIAYHTGIINIDIDVKHNIAFFDDERNVQKLLTMVKEHPYWLASWRSISHGVSFLFKIVPDQHIAAFKSFKYDFAEMGVEVDDCKDITRLRITSYDQDLEYNPLLEQEFAKILPYIPLQRKCKSTLNSSVEEFEDALAQEKTTTTPPSREGAISYAIQLAHSKGKRFEAGTRHNFILFIGGLLNAFGIPMEQALEELDKHLSLSQFENHNKTFIDVYQRLASNFGSSPFGGKQLLINFLSPTMLKLKQPATKVHDNEGMVLVIEKYLSEIDLPDKEYLIVQAPTSCGKTTYFAQKATGRRVLLVPTIALALQIEKAHGIKAIHNNIQVNRYDDVLVGTYESINKIVKTLNISKYELWIDEAHNMVQSSSVNFRNKGLSEICESFDYFKRVVLMSGTWVKTSAAPFLKFETLTVRSRSKRLGQFVVVPTTDSIQSTIERVYNHTDSLHLVYLNNRDKSESTACSLTELGQGEFIPIHAGNKDNDVQKNIILTGLLPEGVRGIVVTDLFKEGISLLSKNIFCIHLISQADSVNTEQIINRVRKSTPTTFCYLKSEGFYSSKEMTDKQRLHLEGELYLLAQKQVNTFEATRTNLAAQGIGLESILLNNMVANKFAGSDNDLVIKPESSNQLFAVNYLAVINSAYQEWQKVELRNPAFYIKNISSYGYEIIFEPTESFEFDKSGRNLNDNGRKSHVKRLEQVKITLEVFAQKGLNYIQEIARIRRATAMELELASKYLFLHDILLYEEDIFCVIEKYSSTKAWNKLKLQLLIQHYIETNANQSLTPASFIDAFVNGFEIGTKYSSSDILNLVSCIHENFDGVKHLASKLTSTKAVQQLNKFFQTKRDRAGKYTILKKGALDYKLKQTPRVVGKEYLASGDIKNTETQNIFSTIDVNDEVYKLIMNTDFSE